MFFPSVGYHKQIASTRTWEALTHAINIIFKIFIMTALQRLLISWDTHQGSTDSNQSPPPLRMGTGGYDDSCLAYPHQPRPDRDVLVREALQVLVPTVQILHERLRQDIKRPLRKTRAVETRRPVSRHESFLQPENAIGHIHLCLQSPESVTSATS